MQPAKKLKQAPVAATPDRSKLDPLDDGCTPVRGWAVHPQEEGETEEEFRERLNAKLVSRGLASFHAVSAGDHGCRIIGLRDIQGEGAAVDLCLEVEMATGGRHQVLLEAHMLGGTECTPLVIPFVRTKKGEHVLVTREHRYALFLHEREMKSERQMADGTVKKPRMGYIHGFPRAFACRAAVPALGEEVFADVPLEAPFEDDKDKFARAVRRVMVRKAGALFRHQGVRPIRIVYLDETPENSGRSSVWLSVFACEIAIDDPDLRRRFLFGDPNAGVLPERFGPAHMRSKFIPWDDLLTKAGREKHDIVDAFSIAAITMFREALASGELDPKEGEETKGEK